MPIIKGRRNGAQLILDVSIVDIRRGADANDSNIFQFPTVNVQTLKALIDTGATSTSITPHAVRQLGLIPLGKREVLTANGPKRVRYYYFKIGFPYFEEYPGDFGGGRQLQFHVLPNDIEGTEFIFDNVAFDILLGMDVISMGELSLNKDGTFSFQFE